MADVAVVGLGNMGSALARALIAAGHEVIVWNRSADKSAPLVALGAIHAPTPDDAVVGAPVVVTCLSDYAALEELLAGVPSRALAGRTFVQLTSGSPEEAIGLSDRLASGGAELLDGYVICPPSAIGSEDASIIYAGPDEVFARHQGIIQGWGPSTHVAEAIGQANVVGRALAIVFYATLGGGFEALAYLAAQGVEAPTFAPLVRSVLVSADSQLTTSADQIARQDFSGDEATIDVHERALARAAAHMARVTKTPHRVTDAMLSHLRDAQAAGLGDQEIGALDTVTGPS